MREACAHSNPCAWRITLAVVTALAGCAALYSSLISLLLLFVLCAVLLLLLESRVKARLARIAGYSLGYPQALYHALSRSETDAAVVILSLLASPLLLIMLMLCGSGLAARL